MPAPWSNQFLIWSQQAGQYGGAAGSLPLQSGVTPNGAAPNASGVSPILDVSAYRELVAICVLASFTGGTTPSFLPEFDILDDANPVDVIPLWKPAAVTAATKWLTVAAAAAGAAPTITGWTVTSIPIPFGAFGQFQWTIAGAPTAVNWWAFLYGKR